MFFMLEIIRLGLRNIALHALRSTLTSLGIILGVAAVIVVVSIGEGNKQATLREIRELGATNIIVRSSKPPYAGSGSSTRSWLVSYGLTRGDMRRLNWFFPDAELIVPLKAAGGEIIRGDDRTVSQAYGTTPDLATAANLKVLPGGRYLVENDIENENPVAVIGSEVARKFFILDDPVGKSILIDNKAFKVVGVLKPIGLAGGAGTALVGRDLNKDVHIPITRVEKEFGDTVIRRASGQSSGELIELSEIYIQASSTEEVLSISERVRRVLETGHPEMNDVQLIVPWELLENARRTMMVWNIMLVAIAGISLLVGGIGIMNIMLASVTERTREIGIRRALGATQRHIVAQFLVETGSISTLGGLIGIALGVGVSLIIGPVVPWILSLPFFEGLVSGEIVLQPVITAWSIVLSFFVAAGVGLIFGVYPAFIASRMDPIVALRHD